MSVSTPVLDLSMIAGADLSGSQYRVVKLDSTARQVVICGASDRPFGVLQNKPAAGEAATVRLLGTTKIVANGAFSLNDILCVAASDGEVDTAGATTAWCVGEALAAAGAAGDIVEMLLRIRPGDTDLSALSAVTDGASGADKIGVTPMPETGEAATVQAVLESLVAALKAVTDGSAGADLVGVTPIAETGEAATVQGVLEALVARLKATSDGASGADLIAITAITTLGAVASVQAALEALATQIGDLSSLETTEKGSLVGAINEIHT